MTEGLGAIVPRQGACIMSLQDQAGNGTYRAAIRHVLSTNVESCLWNRYVTPSELVKS
jgi:hypothetical protein